MFQPLWKIVWRLHRLALGSFPLIMVTGAIEPVRAIYTALELHQIAELRFPLDSRTVRQRVVQLDRLIHQGAPIMALEIGTVTA